MHPIPLNRGKESVILDDVDTPIDDELSSGSSLSLSRSLAKNARGSTKAKLRNKPLHRLAFIDAISGLSRKARREVGKMQNQPDQALGNASILVVDTMPPILFIHPSFDTRLTFYIPLVALIRRPDDMLSLPLGKYILDYKPPHGFVIPSFTTFDGSTNHHDHILHYNQAMILNSDNDWLLCKVFSASLRGPALAWLHKLLQNSINLFNELWVAFISRYLCSVRQKRNIKSLQTILKQEGESIRDFIRRFGQAVQ